jgi:predicted transglutaminase-like cysteine proteinase|tara:strand:+ start:153 stop:470 length:318 start_codon:yes stop_codon:yes gene_type:complete
MKKPALRENRHKSPQFSETNWTKSSKNIGEYIFRRISLDQSNKKLQDCRPRHIMSQLIISSKEVNQYVNDYLNMMDDKSKNKRPELYKKPVTMYQSYNSQRVESN